MNAQSPLSKEFKLVLVDPNPTVCEAWEHRFEPYDNVVVRNDVFENVDDFDCIVSASNSFGFMDGGVDLAISKYFGETLQERVQERIIKDFFGEQPVGTSMIVETGMASHPFLAHTPTMRVPLVITQTDNVYLAMFAMLRAIALHNAEESKSIRVVACPGLGTSAGKVPPREAARQMELAYRFFLEPLKYHSWLYALDRQKLIKYGGDVWRL